MIKAIVFDLFGVIVTDGLQVMADQLAQTAPEKVGRIKELVRASSRGLITPEESNKEIASLFGLSYEDYRAKVRDGEVRNEPLLEYISVLRKDYKTAMLSNVSNGGILRRFAIEELEQYFDVTVASAEIGYAKPEPQAYETVADRLGVRLDECVFTDDREEYCEGAQAVGMRAIHYESLKQFKLELAKILQSG